MYGSNEPAMPTRDWRPRSTTSILILIWLSFLVRGTFYCVLQPLWEGYDEWAHFAYIQYVAQQQSLPHRGTPISESVQRSLLLLPLSQAAAQAIPGAITHDDFWRLQPDERLQRTSEVGVLKSGPTSNNSKNAIRLYEAQQPPLYYLLMTPAFLATQTTTLAGQVLVLRVITMVVASGTLLLSYAIALNIGFPRRLALLVSALIACLPGFYIDACRVANESMAVVLTSLTVLCAIRVHRQGSPKEWLSFGVALGCALLTKAYCLAFVALIPLLVALQIYRSTHRWKTSLTLGAISILLAVGIAGWWYVRIWKLTGSISGEQLDVIASQRSTAERIATFLEVNWISVLDTAAFTHIWVGGWSFLVVRSWIYRVVETVAAMAVLGLIIGIIKHIVFYRTRAEPRLVTKRAVIIAVAYGLMLLVMMYHSVVVFIATHRSMALGWYMYAVVVPEIILVCYGLRAIVGAHRIQVCLAALSVMAITLDLYTVNLILMPYYGGVISHRASGALQTLSIILVQIRLRMEMRSASGKIWADAATTSGIHDSSLSRVRAEERDSGN